jgi:hypothetical protein
MTARGRPKAELVVSGSEREALKRLARQPSTLPTTTPGVAVACRSPRTLIKLEQRPLRGSRRRPVVPAGRQYPLGAPEGCQSGVSRRQSDGTAGRPASRPLRTH